MNDGVRVTDYHRYEPDPRSTGTPPTCRCGMTKGFRAHQPLWWRLLNWGKGWR